MGLSDDLKNEVRTIFRSSWEKREGRDVPEPEDVKLGNDGVELDATVLHADIDGSTSMVDSQPPEFAAEIYKTYLLCASRIIKAEGGTITAYDGDRIMAVFIGKQKNTAAVRCGLKIKWAVKNIVNPLAQEQYPSKGFEMNQVVGIDTSKLLAARTGVRGSNDLVWVGSAANHAAKLTSLSEQPYATFISEKVFNAMLDDTKYGGSNNELMWERRAWKGKTVYRSSWCWRVD